MQQFINSLPAQATQGLNTQSTATTPMQQNPTSIQTGASTPMSKVETDTQAKADPKMAIYGALTGGTAGAALGATVLAKPKVQTFGELLALPAKEFEKTVKSADDNIKQELTGIKDLVDNVTNSLTDSIFENKAELSKTEFKNSEGYTSHIDLIKTSVSSIDKSIAELADPEVVGKRITLELGNTTAFEIINKEQADQLITMLEDAKKSSTKTFDGLTRFVENSGETIKRSDFQEHVIKTSDMFGFDFDAIKKHLSKSIAKPALIAGGALAALGALAGYAYTQSKENTV